MESDFKIGDKVYHRSNHLIVWIIEEIKNNEAFCSTIDRETRKQIKEWLNLVSLAKIKASGNGGIYFSGQRRRSNHY